MTIGEGPARYFMIRLPCALLLGPYISFHSDYWLLTTKLSRYALCAMRHAIYSLTGLVEFASA
jgi:hypothetical protein